MSKGVVGSKKSKAIIIVVVMVLLTVLWVYSTNKVSEGRGYLKLEDIRSGWEVIQAILNLPIRCLNFLFPSVFHRNFRHESGGAFWTSVVICAQVLYFYLIAVCLNKVILTYAGRRSERRA